MAVVARSARLHRRAGVGGLELAHLPLPRHQPQRIEQARADAAADVGVTAVRLEPRPAGDRGRAGIGHVAARRMDHHEGLLLGLVSARVDGPHDEAVQAGAEIVVLAPGGPVAGHAGDILEGAEVQRALHRRHVHIGIGNRSGERERKGKLRGGRVGRHGVDAEERRRIVDLDGRDGRALDVFDVRLARQGQDTDRGARGHVDVDEGGRRHIGGDLAGARPCRGAGERSVEDGPAVAELHAHPLADDRAALGRALDEDAAGDLELARNHGVGGRRGDAHGNCRHDVQLPVSASTPRSRSTPRRPWC